MSHENRTAEGKHARMITRDLTTQRARACNVGVKVERFYIDLIAPHLPLRMPLKVNIIKTPSSLATRRDRNQRKRPSMLIRGRFDSSHRQHAAISAIPIAQSAHSHASQQDLESARTRDTAHCRRSHAFAEPSSAQHPLRLRCRMIPAHHIPQNGNSIQPDFAGEAQDSALSQDRHPPSLRPDIIAP